MVRRENGFFRILISDFHFLGSAISVHCRESSGFPKIFNVLIHNPYEIKDSDGYCVRLALVHVKLKCSVFLLREHH